MAARSELEIILNKSVGVDTLFDITASGLNEKNRHYSSDAKENLTVCRESIGIEEIISITARDGVLDAGNVLKVEIEKTDGNNEKTEETKYIEKLPGTVDIALYDKGEDIVNLDKILRSVKVRISLISAEVYRQKTVQNGRVSVKLADPPGQGEVAEGSILEPSRRVEVSIIPHEGYYVSGRKTEGGLYTQTMKYEKYMSDIDEIIREHEIKKLYQITLETKDDYGECVYKWNGEEITEKTTINVREEDELILVYKLTDENCEIVREEQEGFWNKINKWRKDTFSGKKETIKIPITQKIDGTVIKREDYIRIKKKGE